MLIRAASALGAGVATLSVAAVVAATGAGLVALVGAGAALQVSDAPPAAAPPSSRAASEVPAAYLRAFRAAAVTCPGLPWSVLAGIGRAESDFGADPQTSPAGAVGPMQFLPSTFAAYDTPVPPGGVTPPSPYDPLDAIYAAARLLCANGAEGGTDIPGAIYAYNHSRAYVDEVLSYAAAYSAPAPPSAVPPPRRGRGGRLRPRPGRQAKRSSRQVSPG